MMVIIIKIMSPSIDYSRDLINYSEHACGGKACRVDYNR